MTAETAVPAKEEAVVLAKDEQDHHEHGYHHRRFMPLVSRPIQRQRWSDTQIRPVVNWGDLFFDLFHVAAFYNLSSIIRQDPSWQGLLYFCACFFAILWTWIDKMYFDSRFYTGDDVWHRIFEVAVLVVLATAVVHIRPVYFLSNPQDFNDMFAFSLACVLGNVLTILRYMEVYFWVDGEDAAKQSARRDMIAKLVPMGLYLAAMAISAIEFYGSNGNRRLAEDTGDSISITRTNVPAWLLLGATFASSVYQWIMIAWCYPSGGRHKAIAVPMNIDFAIHRWGEWTMLCLGESVLSLLIVDVTTGSAEAYATFYIGILSVILLQYLHFRSQPHHADEHAMRRKKEAGLGFTYLMQIYSAALILLGTAYKMFLYEYVYEDYEDSHRLLLWKIASRFLAGDSSGTGLELDAGERQQRIANFFCATLGIVFFTQDLMLLMHKGLKDNMGRCRCKHTGKTRVISVALTFIRVGIVVFIVTLRGYVTGPLWLSIIGLCCILAQVILRVVSSIVFPDDAVHWEGGIDEDGNHIMVEDDENEFKWPNTTEAQAVPCNKSQCDDPEATAHSISDYQGETMEESATVPEQDEK